MLFIILKPSRKEQIYIICISYYYAICYLTTQGESLLEYHQALKLSHENMFQS